jgi:serine phosphatase RsbU (regulator of sigma subunit)
VAEQTVAIATASRPHPDEAVNGDAWVVHQQGTTWRIAVIDGLGHGPQAAEAALEAVRALDAHPAAAPASALQLCHAALVGTRGAAISVAVLDLAAARLTYAGIGNVEAHLWQAGRSQRPISYRGIVGSVMRTVRSFEFPLTDDWLLVLHSDGLSSRLEVPTLEAARADLQATADALLARWSRSSDDATVVVAVPRCP